VSLLTGGQTKEDETTGSDPKTPQKCSSLEGMWGAKKPFPVPCRPHTRSATKKLCRRFVHCTPRRKQNGFFPPIPGAAPRRFGEPCCFAHHFSRFRARFCGPRRKGQAGGQKSNTRSIKIVGRSLPLAISKIVCTTPDSCAGLWARFCSFTEPFGCFLFVFTPFALWLRSRQPSLWLPPAAFPIFAYPDLSPPS